MTKYIYMVQILTHRGTIMPEHPFSTLDKAEKYIQENWDDASSFFVRKTSLDTAKPIEEYVYSEKGYLRELNWVPVIE